MSFDDWNEEPKIAGVKTDSVFRLSTIAGTSLSVLESARDNNKVAIGLITNR